MSHHKYSLGSFGAMIPLSSSLSFAARGGEEGSEWDWEGGRETQERDQNAKTRTKHGTRKLKPPPDSSGNAL